MLCVSVAGAKDRDLVQECLKTILSRNCRRIWGVAMDAGVMSRWCITAKRVDKGIKGWERAIREKYLPERV